MTESKRLRERLTFSNVMATVAVFVALGGVSYAATQLPKNSVGAKQLQKNAVTGAKIKKQTITGAKIKKGTLTGTQINLTKLGTVPTAQTANTLGPSEGWRDAALENGWKNSPPEAPFVTAGYYKDLAGVVHLRGVVAGGTLGKAIFHLPPGYRPTSGRVITPVAVCGGCAGGPAGPLLIAGSNISGGGEDGAVLPILGTTLGLDGISFRAES